LTRAKPYVRVLVATPNLHRANQVDDLTSSLEYLSDLSPKDKPWDKHRHYADRAENIYRDTIFDRYAIRMDDCAKLLDFGLVNAENDEQRFRLLAARFCRVRHCPTCQWRRSLKWTGRLFNALPGITEKYPTHRWIFLTLTVKNCDLVDLRSTISDLNKAFARLTQRKIFPGDGWIKSVEITRNPTTGQAHPHLHVLALVPGGYFGGKSYVKHDRWREEWQQCLRVDYLPVVNVKAIKSKSSEQDGLVKAICETLKYSVKEEDLVVSPEWLIELTKQLHKTRAVSVGGELRGLIKDESDDDDLVNIDDNDDSKESVSDVILRFGWDEKKRRYKLK
jgi:plasmid rolling circle replication initiator protein Rep